MAKSQVECYHDLIVFHFDDVEDPDIQRWIKKNSNLAGQTVVVTLCRSNTLDLPNK
jgi:hypothetical protein